MKMKIGFIGLGIMGSRIATNLQNHGYPMVVFNRTRAKAQSLLANSACYPQSPTTVADQVAASAEGMALGEGLGLSRKMLFDSLLGMPAVAPFLAAKRDKIDKGNYEAEFPLRWMQKDMHLASVSAYESGVAMPLTNAAKELYRLAMREGHASQDFSAIYDYLTNNYDLAMIDQKSPAPAMAQLH